MKPSQIIECAIEQLVDMMDKLETTVPTMPVLGGHRIRRHYELARRELEGMHAAASDFEHGKTQRFLQGPEGKPRAGWRGGRELKLPIVFAAMEEHGITRPELATALGVKVEAVHNTLKPGVNVSLERALDYARTLGLRLDEVVDLD